MNKQLLGLIWVSLFSLIYSSAYIEIPKNSDKRIVCYYPFPNSDNALHPKDIDPYLCTHIIAGFSSLKDNIIQISETNERILNETILLKYKNPNLKIMLSLGGGGGDYGFTEMVQNSSNRAQFIHSVEQIIDRLNLDGIDLDWEFPNNIFNKDKTNFINLLQDIRNNIENSVEKYLISIAVGAPITIAIMSYDIPNINRLVDFVNIMCYDYNFYSTLTPWTGVNSPLYAKKSEHFYFATQNINYTSNYWERQGMNKEKLNIGLPTYAHTYTLKSSQKTYLGAPAIGDGVLGGGGSAYFEDVCHFIEEQKLTPIFDDETKSPYVTNGSEWVSFENDKSITYKAEYIFNNNYGGVMIYSLSADDFNGHCNGKTFPLTRIIHKIFS